MSLIVAISGCEVFTGYSDPGFTADGATDSTTDSTFDSTFDTLSDGDAGTDTVDASEAIADGETVDTCACSPGSTERVTGTECPDPDEILQRRCGGDCAWESPACVMPTGWRKTSPAPASLVGRFLHTAVWPPNYPGMILWGGTTDANSGLDSGARYIPSSDLWTAISAAPISGRFGHCAVPTSQGMIVWGGNDVVNSWPKEGAVYDAHTDTWKKTSPSTISGRTAFACANDGDRLFVWGGRDDTTVFSDGAIYDPAADAWSTIASAPISGRSNAASVFVGGEGDIVWGGATDLSAVCPTGCTADGARYDAVTDKWTMLPTASVSERIDFTVAAFNDLSANGGLVVWGGEAAGSFDDGIRLLDSGWVSVPHVAGVLPTGTAARSKAYGWADTINANFYIWSGEQTSSSTTAYDDGAALAVTSGAWSALPSAPIEGRVDGTVVWTGKSAIIWGGRTPAHGPYSDGAIFVP